jgi:hypothetical protein
MLRLQVVGQKFVTKVKAAETYAEFISMNGYNYAHSEKRGLKGFTGIEPGERMKSVGGSEDYQLYATEV